MVFNISNECIVNVLKAYKYDNLLLRNTGEVVLLLRSQLKVSDNVTVFSHAL